MLRARLSTVLLARLARPSAPPGLEAASTTTAFFAPLGIVA